jgi:hypothetical protein
MRGHASAWTEGLRSAGECRRETGTQHAELGSAMTGRLTTLNRGARRLVIASVILLVASAAAWWSWPRGDSRFVGTWLYSPLDDKFPEMELILKRNGAGFFRDVKRPGLCWTLNWRTGDGLLELSGRPAPSHGFLPSISRTVSRMTGIHLIENSLTYKVVNVTQDRIQMQLARKGRRAYPSSLTRVSK